MADLPPTTHIRLERRGPLLHLWLARPEQRNALSPQMVREMLAAFAAIADDRSVRVVVMRGAGGTFCAGGDIKGMAGAEATPDEEIKSNNRRFGALLETINAAPQAVIAAVESAAMGGGFGLACVADVTIAAADARFGMTEVTIGLVPAAISPFVVKRIGLTAARRLAVTGVRLSAQEAVRLGVAHIAAADAAAFESSIDDTCGQILQCAPSAVATTKRLMLRAAGPSPLAELLDEAAEAFMSALRGAEGREGVAAFVAKRKPSWVSQVE